MSAKVDKRGKKFRIIEAKTGKLLLNPAGASRRAEGCEILRTLLGLLRGSGGPRAPVDGGGYDNFFKAQKQVFAINARKNLEEVVLSGRPLTESMDEMDDIQS